MAQRKHHTVSIMVDGIQYTATCDRTNRAEWPVVVTWGDRQETGVYDDGIAGIDNGGAGEISTEALDALGEALQRDIRAALRGA